ncbi:alpha-glycosidase [Tepiditoga spiralis]|uniref:Alpha-glycosidase n=1 Tax=Tepiditoga spiralis TaxID=2108365 RepID=A0A7G1GAA5_9BACT|nr:glycoside hydrolase family 13 protein [Tepiditoga spiralis]BBE31062.1 alpha-glycosidase [Tepiditoga spiralis]
MNGIYSDQTKLYLTPEEPIVGEKVKIRVRVPKYLGKVLGSVYVTPEKNIKKYRNIKMKLIKETELFVYFERSFIMPDRNIHYHFEIELLDKNQKIKYDAMGLVNKRSIHNFVLIPNFKTPEWSHGSIYYQIFVDRFNNGDKTNDPVNDEYIYDGKKIIKKEWNELPSQENGHREFYGGDLKGIMDKIDYLKDLGVETIYLNPIFVSPSPHKYDTQDYENIDPHFGKIVEDTEDIKEKYKVRTTFKSNLKASNSLFLDFVNTLHKNNIKIILDGVFNHCGSYHKWVDELNIYDDGVKNNKNSKYKENFYWNGENYEGWWGYSTLPKLNYSNIKLREYIANIGIKWVDNYKIDGWRLDVADDLGKSKEENIEFWKFFNKKIKSKNKDTIIFAEVYKSPLEWIEKKSWDSIMNYITCMDPVSYFLTGIEKHNDSINESLFMNSNEFIKSVTHALSQLPMNSKFIALNQLSNHDHSRWMTRTTRKIGRINTIGHEEAAKDIDLDVFKIGIMMMFTLPGSPGLYYGDEIGLAGWTDPDNRRPFPWNEVENNKILNFIKKIISIYKKNNALRKGSFEFLNNDGGYLSYGLWNDEKKYIVIINREEIEKNVNIPVWLLEINQGKANLLISNQETNQEELNFNNGNLNFIAPKKSAFIFELKY